MYACSRCGECVDECPVYQETGNKYEAPGYKIKALRPVVSRRILPFFLGSAPSEEELKRVADGLYGCTLCGRCVSVCPYHYDLVDLWETSRESAIRNGLGPAPILEMIQITLAEKNFLKRPYAARKNWTKGENIPIGKKADTVYFVGCVMSYTPTLRSAARSAGTILNAAGENWTILEDEWCCGVPLKFGGGTEKFREFVEHNVAAIEATGANKVISSCPGCYRMIKQEYPKALGRPLKFSVIHMTELVDEYAKSGKVSFSGKLEAGLTYHDPCELSRLLGIVDAPRNVFSRIATKFAELPENRYNTHCCGGGGLYKAMNTEMSLNIAQKRIGQAENLGAEIMAAACPACFMNLSQAARFKKSGVKVLDFAEIVAQQIQTKQ